MADSRIVFVVGAGASKEVSLPTGKELRQDIAKRVDIRFRDGHSQSSGSKQILGSLRHYLGFARQAEINDYLHAGWRIRDAMPQAISIDNYIDNTEDEKIEIVGKLAIVEAILEAEQKSPLYIENAFQKPNFASLETTWFSGLMDLITEGTGKSKVGERTKRFSFIIFNYDRCIEQFLYFGFQNYYGFSKLEAAAIIGDIDFIHPYGTVGDLPFLNAEQNTEFGGHTSHENLLHNALNIKTFTDQVRDKGLMGRISTIIRSGDILVFLGFGFHQQNMDLLSVGSELKCSRVYGSAYERSQSDISVITKQIQRLTSKTDGRSVEVSLHRDLKCHQVLNEHWLAIKQ